MPMTNKDNDNDNDVDKDSDSNIKSFVDIDKLDCISEKRTLALYLPGAYMYVATAVSFGQNVFHGNTHNINHNNNT